MTLGRTKLILASRSAPRARLLREAGYDFEQVVPPFNDPPQPSNGREIDPDRLAADLALKKAQSVVEQLVTDSGGQPGSRVVVLGADTICIGTDGLLIGTPADRDQAERMIRSFASRAHRVATGVAILSRAEGSTGSRRTSGRPRWA